MKRKLIASLLCLCMLVSLLPVAAFATGGTDTESNTVTTLPDLKTKLEADGTATITLNVTGANNVIESSDYFFFKGTKTLDLNGKTLKFTNNWGFISREGSDTAPGGSLTLKNGTVESNGNAVYLNKYSSLTIEATATVKSTTQAADNPTVTVIGPESTVTVDGKINTTGNSFALSGRGNEGEGDVTVTINAGAEITATNSTAVYFPNTTELKINGGTISGTTGIYQKSGKLTISDGTIKGIGTKADYVYDGNGCNSTGDAVVTDLCNYPGGAPTIEITGGNFISTNNQAIAVYSTNKGQDETVPTSFITGGTFSSDPSNVMIGDETVSYVASNSVVTENGSTNKTYTVSPATSLVIQPIEGENGVTSAIITGIATDKAPTGDADDNSTATNIKVDVSANGGDKTANAQVTIPAATAQTMTEVQTVEVKANDVTVTLPQEAVSKIADVDDGKQVNIEVKDVTPSSGSGAPAKVISVKVESATGSDVAGTNLLPANANDNGTIKIKMPVADGAKYVYHVISNNSGGYTPVELVKEIAANATEVEIEVGHLSMYAQYSTKSGDLAAQLIGSDGAVKNAGTFDAMWSALATGDTIKLLDNVTLNAPIKITDKSVKIDGQGHSISADSDFTIPKDQTPAMIFLAATDGPGVKNENAQLELSNVTLNANNKARVIYGGTATLTINEGTTITGGKVDNSYIGGVYMSGGKLVMNGGTITGNAVGSTYANDGHYQYSSDLWIGNLSVATIAGGTIGNAFFNSNGVTAEGQSGANVTMTGGSIDTAFVEAAVDKDGNKGTATVAVSGNAAIKDVLVAMDYDDANRVVASLGQVKGTQTVTNIKGLDIPAGATATVVTNGTATDPAEYILTNGITINTGATLTVPENTKVTVQKSGSSSAIPTITNNGSLIVNGSLIAGSTDTDSDKLNFTGNGAVTGSGTIDVDKTNTATVKLDVAGGTGVDAEYTVIITAGSSAKATFTLPIPTRSGYTFQGWTDSTGKVVTSVQLGKGDEASFTAQWKLISSGNTGGGSSSSVSVPSATNGKVTVSNSNAKKGDTVTITLTPNTGYVVDTVTVTDSKGNAVTVSKTDDTHYTFTMPDGRVTVRATFKQVDTPPATGFTDVAADAYYADAVKWAVDKGITNGLTATTFGPNNSCTRGQMVTFLWRAAGSPAATGTNSFTDVASGEYYYNAVLWAVEKGITNGTSATTFSPNATVNRGQTVTFLYRYAESPAATGDTSFTDVTADAFYADAVKWAVAEGITNGTSDTTFAPASNCTRGQIVTFMYRQMAE